MNPSPRAPSNVEPGGAVALYYPYFSVRDELWAKQILILWDRLVSIVPQAVTFDSVSTPLSDALYRYGALETWSVDEAVRMEAVDLALNYLDRNVGLFPETEESFRIHFGKVTYRLLPELERRQLRATEIDGWIEVDHQVGLLILAVLAHSLARRTTTPPLTDQPEVADAYVALGRQAGTRAAIGLVHRDVSLAVPDLTGVDLEKWLRFRNQHAGSLSEYRSQLLRRSREVARAADADHVDELIADWSEDSQRYLDQNKTTFRKFLTGDVGIAVLEVVAAVGSGFAATDVAGGAGVLTGIGSVATAADAYRRLRQAGEPQQHYLSFLAKLEKKFG